MSRFNSWEYRPNNSSLQSKPTTSQFVYEQTMQKYSPVYKSPVSSKQRLNLTSDNLSSETRQKTEPNSQNNLYKAELREKELLLKKSQQEIQVLRDENQSLIRLNQQYKLDLQGLHEENNKKTIKIGMIEMQLDVLKRKTVSTFSNHPQQKEQDREFRSQSSHVQQSRDSSPYRNQQMSIEDELYQLRQDKTRLQSEVLNQKKIIHELSKGGGGSGKVLPQSKSDTEFRNLRDFYKNEIEDLKSKLVSETTAKSSDRKYQHRISNLEIEIASMKDQQAFTDEQLKQLQVENQSLRDFMQEQMQKNKTLMRSINDLQLERERLVEKLAKLKLGPEKDQQQLTQLRQENNQLRNDVQQILDENDRLSHKISELYLDLNAKNNNDDLNTIRQQQVDQNQQCKLQLQGLQEQISKATEDRKRLNAQLEMMKKEVKERDEIIASMQQQKSQQIQSKLDDPEVVVRHSVCDIEPNEEFESAIKVKEQTRFLPEMGVGSHVNCVLHILEALGSFSSMIRENANSDETCQSMQRLFDFVNTQGKMDQQDIRVEAAYLTETFQIEPQLENRANDFLFQIIDTFSKILLKDDSEEGSAISKIIQQRDSPIFDLFFFLQRSLPLNEEIQPNEVPLINSIKHVKLLEQQAKVSDTFEGYLQELIRFEGNENGLMDSEQFNFVVCPNVLIFNVLELSQAKCNMIINQEIDSASLTNEQSDRIEPFRYRLIAMIHCSQGLSEAGNEPLYYLTIETPNGWVQVLYDQYEQINKIEQILTFKKNQGDKELLVYEKILQ